MIKKFLTFLHSDEGLQLAGVLMTVSYLVESLSPPNSIAHSAAGKLLQAGVILGITSTRGRAKAEAPAPKA